MIKKGTNLRSRATGAIVPVIAAEFDLFGMTYTVEISGLKRHYTYDTLMAEYTIIDESPIASEEVVCKCGGYKTYNSLDCIYHAQYCYYGKDKP